MLLALRVIFILSSNVIIHNLPVSYGRAIEGYRQTTLNEVLTPIEKENYILYGTLPSRVSSDYSGNGYIVNVKQSHLDKDQRKQKSETGQGYKLVPRWKYLLDKVVPDISLVDNLNPNKLKQNGSSNYDIAKNVVTSDLTKTAVKFGISFLPAGGMAVKAMETVAKIKG